MSDKQEGQNFLQGTAVLAMATVLVKILGAVYKIPLNAVIGEQGFGYFVYIWEGNIMPYEKGGRADKKGNKYEIN